jgi:hypothetical protein
MAFIDFTQPLAGPSHQIAAHSAIRAESAAFGTQEWQIIGLARKDGLRSLREPTRFERLTGLIFGPSRNRQLANGRLEALRRLAVEAWHRGYAVSLSALAAFRAAGFTKAQLELLLATISAGRAVRRSGNFA